MEFLNRIELKGIVGNCRLQSYDDSTMARISLATNETHTSKDGYTVIETTWHNIIAWKGDKTRCLDAIRKGSALHVKGRLRRNTFTRQDGTETQILEVIADSVELIDN